MSFDVTEEEINFIDAIDASFPFEDEEKARSLVSNGAALSEYASFMVAYELATENRKRFFRLRLSLFEQLCREHPTPAFQVAAPVIISLIKEEPFPEGSVEALLKYSKEKKDSYGPVQILSLCSPEMEKEANNLLKK